MKSKNPLGILICASMLFIAAFPAGVAAQSGSSGTSFVFPRFISCNDQNSGIAIMNPNPWDASVSLKLTMANGSAGPSSTITVPAYGQIARTAGQLFKTGCADAWLEATSAMPGLIAGYQAFDSQLTYIDGTGAALEGMDLLFPVIPRASEGEAEIDLLNQSPRVTAVELSLWSLSGTLLGKTKVQLGPGAEYRNLAENIFPAGTDLSNASHITATSKPLNLLSQAQSVSGTSLLIGFSSQVSASGGIDVAAFNALTPAQASNAGVLPYFRTGRQYASTISLANVESSAVDVTLTAIDNNGGSLGSRKLSLNGNGGYRAPIQTLYPSLGAGENEGWVLVSATGRIFATMIHGRSDAASLSAISMQKTPLSGLFFPQFVEGNGYSSELTLVNPTRSAASAEVFVLNPDGTTAASSQLSIAANGRISRTLGQIVPEVTDQSSGFVYIQGAPLFAALSITADNGTTVSSLAPELSSVAFTPALPTSFAATGKVTLNDRPAAGFRVALSGPVSKVTTTASDGFYAFTGLLPGHYSMMVDQYGFQFIPAQTDFEITTSSKRQDFQGYTSADAIVVQPPSMPVGSDDTVAAVFGLNFNSSSQAYAGSVRLDTTFVDPSQLRILVPAYMMAHAAQLDIYVVTNNLGPDRRATLSFSFVAYVDRPSLSAIMTSDNIAEGAAGTVITLNGAGFLIGAEVKINGQSDGIEVTVISDRQIMAYVPASYLQQGGIYPVTVQNPYPANVESNIQLLTVFYPAAGIDAVVPGAVMARLEPGAGPVTLEVLGYGFRRGAVVLFNGKQMTTAYCENDPYCLATHLYAKVPASELRSSGFAEIEVQNPSPSFGLSKCFYVPVYGLEPAIESVLPGMATMLNVPGKFTIPIVITGANFGPQTQVRIYRASDPTENYDSPTQLLGSTQLTYDLDVDPNTAVGEWIVMVMNPQPGGGVSQSVSFFITQGAFSGNPFIVSMNPTVVAAGGPGFTLVLNGTNFKSGAQVQFNMAVLDATVVSNEQIMVDVPSFLLQTAGRVPISVINPDTGGASNRLYLDIR